MPMRLAKYLAHSGVASRRASERLIAAGRVSVDGHAVTDPATLAGPVSKHAIESLRRGVELDDGPARAQRVRRLAPDTLELVLREGRKRQVRRMCEAVGNRVVALERTAIGSLELGGLAAGDHRRLTEVEIELLRQAER